MRKTLLGVLLSVVVVTGMSAAPASAQDYDEWKAPPPVDHSYEPKAPEPQYEPAPPPRTRYEPSDYRGPSYCGRLRYRCFHREELGLMGEGVCRRYHEECGDRDNDCDRLRRACQYRYERGEVGQGNCRRYHEECRGGY